MHSHLIHREKRLDRKLKSSTALQWHMSIKTVHACGLLLSVGLSLSYFVFRNSTQSGFSSTNPRDLTLWPRVMSIRNGIIAMLSSRRIFQNHCDPSMPCESTLKSLVKCVEYIALNKNDADVTPDIKMWKSMCQPSQAVGLFWCAHMQSPDTYAADCRMLFGDLLNNVEAGRGINRFSLYYSQT